MYWWLIGVAAWYATAAVVVRQIPRGWAAATFFHRDQGYSRLITWALSPLIAVAVPALLLVAAFIDYVLMPPPEKNP